MSGKLILKPEAKPHLEHPPPPPGLGETDDPGEGAGAGPGGNEQSPIFGIFISRHISIIEIVERKR